MQVKRKRQKKLPPQFSSPLLPENFTVCRCSVGRGEAAIRILIMRVGAHGDILMGTPLLAALRAHYPQAHLTWLVEYNERGAIEANPYVDEVLLWDSGYFKRFMRKANYPLWLIRALQFRAELRQRRYDIFISFQPEEWPLLIQGVGAPVTIGIFDTFRQFTGAVRTSRYARFYSHPFQYSDLPPHRTDQYLLPLKALELPEATDKRMQMGYTAGDAQAASDFLQASGLTPGQPFVALAPMTTWLSRCWPGECYAELGDALAARAGCSMVIIGSAHKQEQEAIVAIAARMRTPPILATGVLTFRQMAALIARSSLLISGDTGPMHVAAAVGTPYLALFGPTPVAGRVPLAGPGRALWHPVPCGPCDQKVCPNVGDDYMRCMKLLTVEEALEAAESLLKVAVFSRA